MKIVTRLVLLFLLVGVLPLSLFSYYNLRGDEETLRMVKLEELSSLADKKLGQIHAYLAARQLEVRIRARGPEVVGAMNRLPSLYRAGRKGPAYQREEHFLNEYFSRYVEETGLFYDVFLITRDGEVIYTKKREADLDTNLENGLWRDTQLASVFREVGMTMEPAISGYEYYEPSHAPALFIAAPVMVKGRYAGVIAVQLNNELLYQVALDPTGLGMSGEALFAQRDGNGVLFTTPLKYRADAAMKFRLARKGNETIPMFSALDGTPGEGIRPDYRGMEVAAAWRYIPGLNWGMVVKVDAAEVFASIHSQRIQMLEVVAALLVIIGLLAGYFGRQISRPVKELQRVAAQMAAGDLDARAETSRTAELGQLAASFNSMADSLSVSYRSLAKRVAERTRNLEEVNERLRVTLEDLRYQKFALDQHAIVATTDVQGTITYVNEKFCEISGYAENELIGHNHRILSSGMHDTDFFREMYRTIASGKVWNGEICNRAKDGRFYWVLTTIVPYMGKDGKPVQYISIRADITGRKNAEQRLERTNALLESLIDDMPAMVFVKRASDLTFERFNHAGEQMLGISEPELVGKSDRDFFPPEQADSFTAMDREVLESHQLKDIPEEEVRTRDGETRILHTRKVGLYDSTGKPTHLLGFSIDITERAKAQRLLELHKRVLDLAQDGFWMADMQGVLLEVNSAYAEISGYSMGELVGMRIAELEAQQRPEDIKANIEQIIARGYGRFETRHRHKDGHLLDIEVSTIFIADSQQFAVFLRDITASKQAQAALLHHQELLADAERLGHLGSWELDMEKNTLHWSDEIYRIFEIDHKRYTPSYEAFLGAIHPDDREAVDAAYTRSLLDRTPYDIEHRLLMADGRIKWVREHCSTDFDESGKALRSVGAVQDITARKLAETELRRSQTLLSEAQRLGRLGSWELDHVSGELRWSDEIYRIFGLDQEAFLPSYENFLSVIHPEDREEVDAAFQRSLIDRQPYDIEHRLLMVDGSIKWVREHCYSDFDTSGRPLRSVGAVQDITERKQAEEEIRSLAYYDVLTGLPNRRLLLDRFRVLLAGADRKQNCGAVLFLDMDKFKLLNDTLGHDYGDKMLIEVGRRIYNCLRETDTVARLGGDEFVMLIGELGMDMASASEQVARIAEKIRSVLAEPYLIKGQEFRSSPSIGARMFKGGQETVELLMKEADSAMYQAKEKGRNRVCFFESPGVTVGE